MEKLTADTIAVVKQVTLPAAGRAICVSDVHGNLDLFTRLLDKVKFSGADMLILLGDLYTKGTQSRDTLRYMMELSTRDNVHIVRGNADWLSDNLSADEVAWIQALPHILEAQDYIFVHAGLTTEDLSRQTAFQCIKNDNFLEKSAPRSGKWLVVGHWPVAMYHHDAPDSSPIVDREKRIISIDGGNVLKPDGQLNAFIIENGAFSHDYADKLEPFTVPHSQEESGGTLNITWLDRFIELVEDAGLPQNLCRVRHLATGRELTVPHSRLYTDMDGRVGVCDCATDYHLPVAAGEIVGLVEAFADRVYAKKSSRSGWIKI